MYISGMPGEFDHVWRQTNDAAIAWSQAQEALARELKVHRPGAATDSEIRRLETNVESCKNNLSYYLNRLRDVHSQSYGRR